MQRFLSAIGLHLDQQSLSNLWTKGLGIASLVAGGFLNPAAVLHDGFGVVISEAANGRIKWWAVAIGVVVTYFTSQNTDQRASSSSASFTRSLPIIWLVAALGTSVIVSGCANLNKPRDPAVVARQIAEKTNPVEHAIQPLQDLEIQAERAALVLAPDVARRDVILKAHIKIQQDIKKLSADVRHIAEVALGIAPDPVPLGQLIQHLIAEVQPIANDIEMQFGVSTSTRTAIGAAATVISAAIATIATS